MSIAEKLNRVVARHDELRDTMATQTDMDSQELQRIAKEFAELTEVVKGVEEFRAMEAEIQDLADLITDSDTVGEMRTMAEEEFHELKQKIPKKEREIQLLLLPKDEADEKNAILEVRAGTGGDEAALFAADLFRMYQRYAEQHKWKFEPIDINETGIGGYKEASANITGKGVFAKLKFESGVHRVQRVRKQNHRAAFIPRRPRSRCCLKPKKLTFILIRKTCVSTPTGRREPVASMSIKPIAPFGSLICRPILLSSARMVNRSTKTAPRR